MTCYKFEEINFKDPIFKEVQATYIIHLEGNGRFPVIQEQLQKYHPTETVYILFNKGFKKCQKDPSINISYLDLVDAFFQCFKHANEKGYENILILEDDFMFDEKILEPCHVPSIETFLNSKIGDNYIYYLGCAPYLQLSSIGYHDHIFLCVGMHACIYPKTFIQNILKQKQSDILDWDKYTMFNCTQFKYYKPLCYQLWSKTENQSNWGTNFIEAKIAKTCLRMLIYLKLDTQCQPGYDILYKCASMIFWTILFTFVLMITSILFFIWKNMKWLKKNWNYYIYIFAGIIILYPVSMILFYLLLIVIFRIYYLGFS